MKLSFDIKAESRHDAGKGASRRLRHAGKVPAILYGGNEPPANILLDHTELALHLEHESFYSHILKLHIDGKEQQAILKDLQRHPAKRQIVHADFQRVVAGMKLRMTVPLHFKGETEAPGSKAGGVATHIENNVDISCLPEALPEFIEVDVAALGMDDVVHLSDLVLPEGVELVELTAGRDHPVFTFSRPRKEEEEEKVEAAPLEGEAPVEGATAEAAPAKAGDKKAPEKKE
jgi:large subunit ribosomal protein L25